MQYAEGSLLLVINYYGFEMIIHPTSHIAHRKTRATRN
jgi:hypothetical protein